MPEIANRRHHFAERSVGRVIRLSIMPKCNKPRSSGNQARERPLPSPCTALVWRPSIRRPRPQGLPDLRAKLSFLLRWLLNFLLVFAHGQCGAVCVYLGQRLVHYSAFTPRYWRFALMASDDIQIGYTWTDPAYRAKGLAFFALEKVLVTKRRPGRFFWYGVEAVNHPSIRVVQRAVRSGRRRALEEAVRH